MNQNQRKSWMVVMVVGVVFVFAGVAHGGQIDGFSIQKKVSFSTPIFNKSLNNRWVSLSAQNGPSAANARIEFEGDILEMPIRSDFAAYNYHYSESVRPGGNALTPPNTEVVNARLRGEFTNDSESEVTLQLSFANEDALALGGEYVVIETLVAPGESVSLASLMDEESYANLNSAMDDALYERDMQVHLRVSSNQPMKFKIKSVNVGFDLMFR